MSYPVSSDVSSGQPTAAAHYNNLRADALRFGQAAADAVNLGALMFDFSANLNLVYLAANRVRIVASALSPVSLMIQGVPCQVVANVDLSTSISGSAAVWYLFANRADDASTFTLTANTSATPTSIQRLIGQCYWTGSALVPGSIVRYDRAAFIAALDLVPVGHNGGRLTLVSGVPLSYADASGNDVYFSPFVSRVISLYAPGFGWVNREFSQLTATVPATASTVYDVFASWDGSAVTLTLTAWSSASARASAVALQDGVWCLSSDKSLRLLGSVATDAAGIVKDSELERLVFNVDNQRPRILSLSDGTTHTYAVSAWRFWNDDADNHADFLAGLTSALFLNHYGDQNCATAGAVIRTGLALDDMTPDVVLGNSGGGNFKGAVALVKSIGEGVHVANMLEYANASYTCNYYSAQLNGIFYC